MIEIRVQADGCYVESFLDRVIPAGKCDEAHTRSR